MDTSNPLLLPEIVGLVIDNVDLAADILNCACVNALWNTTAMKKLYSGSLTDMQFRTPNITSLNCLFVASRDRFIRNMSFVKHLLLLPEVPTREAERRVSRLVGYEKCRLLRCRKDAELLFRPKGRGLASISIPFELVSQGWSSSDIEDLLLPSTAEFIAIANNYCKYLWPPKTINPELHSVSLAHRVIEIQQAF